MNHEGQNDLMKKIGKQIKFQQKILFFICSIVALFFPGFTVVIIAKAIKDAINKIPLNENLLLQQFIEELK